MDSPRIGIALSSGGAAGLAHIGVLDVLTAHGLDITCVAGTSAGALVGAAFASGQLSGMHECFVVMKRRQLMRLFDPSWAGGGLFAGRRAMELVRPFLGDRIEDLPRRFAAVATDLLTGRREVFCSGSVHDAVRASAAVPGVFTPALLDGRLLVDGALVDPVPVEAARALGAGFIIAVSVIPPPYAAPLLSACQPPADDGWLSRSWRSVSGWLTRQAEAAAATVVADPPAAAKARTLSMVLARSSVVVQSQLAAARLREHAPDVLIQPDVGTIGLFDFDRAAEAIDAGRQAAEAALPQVFETLKQASRRRGSALRRLAGGSQAA